MRNRVAVALAIALPLGLALAGCSGSAVPTPTNSAASSFVGQTLQNAIDAGPGSVASRDASKALGLRRAAPDLLAMQKTVIAACYHNAGQVNVMVIPSDSVTKTIAGNAKRGEYDSLLDQCEK